jgi:hypothetical protein
MTSRVPSCVWRLTPEIVVALNERFSIPTDAYVNGSQVWLRDDGPGDTTLEWRLHPVASYRKPKHLATEEVFELIAVALGEGGDQDHDADEAPPYPPVESLWDGLEAFPAFDDEMEPAALAAACTAALGMAPDAYGLVDHTTIGDQWESTMGAVSVVDALFAQLLA